MTLLFSHITAHLCLLAFVALTFGALPCGPNVYDLDIVIGSGRVTGSIQTDGTVFWLMQIFWLSTYCWMTV
jgi:hypothetical protein